MKKILSVLLASVLSIGCNGCMSTPDSSSGDSQTDATEEKYNPDAGIDFNSPLKTITDGGSSDYRIVIPSAYNECLSYASDFLKSYLQKATGATLKIIGEDAAGLSLGDKLISLGKTKLFKKSGVEIDKNELNYDGFRINTVDDTVFICGYRDKGTLYGVYDFLEKFVGVKFLTPDYTHIQKVDKLQIHSLDIIEVPAFQIRTFLSAANNDKGFQSLMRTGHDWGVDQAKYGGGNQSDYDGGSNVTHNVLEVVDQKIYYPDHPEMFSVLDGVPMDICYSNGILDDGSIDESKSVSCAKVAIENLKKRATKNTEARYFSIDQTDYRDRYCRCETCMRRERENGGRSGILMMFISAVADKFVEWMKTRDPDREVFVTTFAYQFTEAAPVVKQEDGSYKAVNKKVVPSKNVYVRVAPIDADFYHAINSPEQSEYYKELFASWSAITDRFLIWDYHCNYSGLLYYFPDYSTTKENFCYYEKLGAQYVLAQSDQRNVGSFQNEIKTYVYSKLLWNPHRDVGALVKEFCNYYYLQEADAVLDIIDMFETHFAYVDSSDEYSTKFYLAESDKLGVMNVEYYPLSLLETAMSKVNEAIDRVNANPLLSESEKYRQVTNLIKIYCTPQYMIMNKHNDYYDSSSFDFTAFARNFFENAERANITHITEMTMTLAQYKASLGL